MPGRRHLSRRGCALALMFAAACAPKQVGREPEPAEPPIRSPAVTKPISLAILEDYDKGHDLELVARDFGLFRELGITTWRGSFGWDDYEPEPGTYDFEWLHRFVALAADSGITLRPYIAYTPEWAAAGRRNDGHIWNDPPASLEMWGRFVDTLAAALGAHPNVASWEIYNEENVSLWWDGTAAEYNAVLARAAERIRARDPDAQVLLGGTVWPDSDWLETTCVTHRNAKAFDIAPFHAYPETWPDTLPLEAYLDENFRRWYLEAIDSACGGKPVWINEAGYATTAGRTEEDQARWWARAFPLFLAAPRVEHIGVYEIRDLRSDSDVIGDAPNYFLGLVRVDGTPKLAFHTVSLLARLFRGDSLTVVTSTPDSIPPGVQRHLFHMPDGRQLIFAWRHGEEPGESAAPVRLVVTLPRPGREALSYGLGGDAAPVRLGAGGATLLLELDRDEVAMVEILR